ncbi:cobyrinic acid a,c-diamide synthase [Cladochytrium replicatum]|nr:cobyrinic acid a,c-diamide synthase [Cladochytrium replicatum]
MKTFIVSAPSSSQGKTSVSLGLMRAFTRKGLIVQPFKIGPDFIDPMHHCLAVRNVRPSINLDGFMLGRETTLARFRAHAKGADVCVIEGVMGLFDGRDGLTDVASTAEVAKWLDAPVLLVVDCWSMCRSVGAVARGFRDFDPALKISGVICNKTGGKVHADWLRDAIQGPNCQMHFLGALPKAKDKNVEIPERHLGLQMPTDFKDASYIDALADLIEANIDLDALLDLSVIPTVPDAEEAAPAVAQQKVRIAVAKDEAFCFYYQDNIHLLTTEGAEVVYFSPMRDQKLPDNAQGLYIGGGYPELYAGVLEANKSMLNSIRHFAKSGGAIFAECGGMMYLSQGIWVAPSRQLKPDDLATPPKVTPVDTDHRYETVGVLPFSTRLTKTMRLSYIETGDSATHPSSVFAAATGPARGHVYHFSQVVVKEEDAAKEKTWMPAFMVRKVVGGERQDAEEKEGYVSEDGRVVASWVHLHWGSNPTYARSFVQACAK